MFGSKTSTLIRVLPSFISGVTFTLQTVMYWPPLSVVAGFGAEGAD
jgi:hypothetical protein